MIRVLLEEWRSGGSFSKTRILPAIILSSAAALFLTQFQPGALFLVLVVAGLVGGGLSGTQRWNQLMGRDWISLERTGVVAYAVGKVLGLGLVLGAWALLLGPAVMLVFLPWGLPWSIVVEALAWALVAALVTQALGHLVTWGPSGFQRGVAVILVVLWIIVTLQVPEAAVFNPLWQVWRLFRGQTPDFDMGAWLTLVGTAVGVWMVVLGFLKAREGRR